MKRILFFKYTFLIKLNMVFEDGGFVSVFDKLFLQ